MEIAETFSLGKDGVMVAIKGHTRPRGATHLRSRNGGCAWSTNSCSGADSPRGPMPDANHLLYTRRVRRLGRLTSSRPVS
jgi:hypothetical protein